MTSSSEDFTSDDLINGGFSNTKEEDSAPGEAPVTDIEEQVEIPKGADDNSELFGFNINVGQQINLTSCKTTYRLCTPPRTNIGFRLLIQY